MSARLPYRCACERSCSCFEEHECKLRQAAGKHRGDCPWCAAKNAVEKALQQTAPPMRLTYTVARHDPPITTPNDQLLTGRRGGDAMVVLTLREVPGPDGRPGMDLQVTAYDGRTAHPNPKLAAEGWPGVPQPSEVFLAWIMLGATLSTMPGIDPGRAAFCGETFQRFSALIGHGEAPQEDQPPSKKGQVH